MSISYYSHYSLLSFTTQRMQHALNAVMLKLHTIQTHTHTHTLKKFKNNTSIQMDCMK